MKIAAIVVTYNRCELLLECIQALKTSEIPVDILIIDNASTDDTSEKIKPFAAKNELLYFNTLENSGGAGGFHFGIKKAYELNYDYFWLMDDDTIVKKDSLTHIINFARQRKDDYGFLSSLALWKDDSVCNMNYHTVASDWNSDKNLLTDGIIKIQTGTFVSFFTRREVVSKVGLPVKEYFVWGDDAEYSARISDSYPCYLVANSQVFHKMDENIATSSFAKIDDPVRIQRMFFSVRNDCCTYKRRGFLEFVKYFLRLLKTFLDVLVTSKPYKSKKLLVLVKGFFAGLFFFPKIDHV